MEIPRGTVRSEYLVSRALEGNLPGDPHVRELYLYLPPGYDQAEERYPVAWCLSGFTGRGRMLLNDNPWSPGIADRMDALLAQGAAKPMILALTYWLPPRCVKQSGRARIIGFTHLG